MADPVAAQQVARQMEALLQEKSKLVAENDRLLRENTGLQVQMWGVKGRVMHMTLEKYWPMR